jgi:hypothetical protein
MEIGTISSGSVQKERYFPTCIKPRSLAVIANLLSTNKEHIEIK